MMTAPGGSATPKPGPLARLKGYADSPAGKRTLGIIQIVFTIMIAVYLAFRLAEIDWPTLAAHLPGNPLFYGLFAIKFMIIPMTEYGVYGRLWGQLPVSAIAVFVRKRIFNTSVMGYSGEGFLSLWAQRTLDMPVRTILSNVKDVSILSAFTANAATVLLAAALFAGGVLPGAFAHAPEVLGLSATALGVALVAMTIVLVLRKRIFALAAGPVRRALFLFSMRQLLQVGVTTAMFLTVLPLSAWPAGILFAAIQVFIARVPLMPNQDLVFLGVALAIAKGSNMLVASHADAIRGLVVAEIGLSQSLSILLYFATGYLARLPAQNRKGP